MTSLDTFNVPIVANIRLQRANGYWSVGICLHEDSSAPDHSHYVYVGCATLTDAFEKIRDHIDAHHALKLNSTISEIASQPTKGNS